MKKKYYDQYFSFTVTAGRKKFVGNLKTVYNKEKNVCHSL